VKILMTSTSYPENAEDWRGRFIANLAAGLGRRENIQLSLWAPPGVLPAGVDTAASAGEHRWLLDMSQRGGIAHLLRHNKLRAAITTGGLLTRLRRAYQRHDADVMHVNWLQNALPLLGTKATPTVVSVLGTDFGLLRLPGMKPMLRRVFRQRKTILAPNAEWMAARLKSAFGDVAEIRTVQFGVDASWYALERRAPQDGVHHWLTITRLTRNKIGDLFNWGAGLFGPNRILHLFGPMQEEIKTPEWIRYHGSTHPAELLNTWFPKASGLITLSRHDEGRPQVMLEAMAASLPIIASDLPAHQDFIKHGQTGWLTTSKDDFENALNQLEQQENNRQLGEAARVWVKENIGSWDDCAAHYAALYAQLAQSDRRP